MKITIRSDKKEIELHMESKREHIYLAALLHDIGKFYQRADKSFSDKQNEMSKNVLGLADYICPLDSEGNFGYQHTLWTAQFLEEIETKLKQIPDFTQNVFDKETQDNIYQLAAYHHKPSTELQALISLADWWSAGIDRRERLETEDGDGTSPIKWGNQRYKRIPLFSIFNKINDGNYNSAFGLKALSIEENDFFPSNIEKKEDGISQEKYAVLWKQFKKEIEALPTDSFEGFAESLFYLLKKYTWCIPSNTTDMANVSLFDHLKTTAAFADCLYVYKQENPDDFVFQNNRITLKENVKPVILLGGDLSGIQKFIYNIASRKAAVSLKGRSFYLQLLIDSIIQRIISHENIKATLGHVVYSSGGKFYMLLPNTEKVKKTIDKLKVAIEEDLWEKHHGQLIVNIDFVPFAYNNKERKIDFENDKHETVTNQPIGELWKTLADKLTNQKNQKFKTLLNNNFGDLFEVQPVNKDAQVCAVTGIEDKCEVLDSKEEIKTYVLPIVRQQAELGKTLKDADCILTHLYNEESSYLNTRSKSNITIFSVSNYLFDEKELKKIDDEDLRQITSADTCRVRWINNTSFLDPNIKGNNLSYGFQFYGGNEQAKKSKNELKTFEELADDSYLGVLRMDVDNLGAIFIKGLPDEDKSFSAYATLSFMLDYFFSGYLNTIRKRDNFLNDVNIIYSGGDDVFAVGKWNKLIEFAEAIRSDFGKFVGRDDISISGGIAIVGDKFPIAKAAEMAGDAESAAKKYRPEKNAFNMFGETISWGDEFEFVKDYKNQFVELCDEKGENMPRSILHRIMTFADMKKRGEISYVWNTAYFLKRFSRGKSDTITSFCRNLSTELLEPPRNYELIALAARWAELELKKRNNV